MLVRFDPAAHIRLALMLLAVNLLLVAGCDTGDVRRPTNRSSDSSVQLAAGSSHLAIALNRLEQLDVGIYSGHETRNRIAYHLQEWSKQQQGLPDWVADPMLSRLPSGLNIVAHPDMLPSLQFHPSDVTFLTECIMMRNVAQQAIAMPLLDPRLQAELDAQRETMSDPDGDKLLHVAKLFDWTVRNLQLDPLDPPWPEDGPPEQPQPKPGARRFVWQAVLIGRADAWTRARTFILLARQQRIPVVVLGVEQEPEPKPWLVAAWIGGQLYLFDPQLGLALPGQDGQGIATLDQLREHPELLAQNDVLNGPEYPWSADHLRRLIALIDAVPEALSQRMAVVERALTGEHKMVLTTQASELASELQATQLVLRSQIWTQPYDTQLFQLVAINHPATRLEFRKELQPLEGNQPLARARRLHLRGIYDNDPPRQGARAWYLAARPSNRELEVGEDLSEQELREQLATVLELPDAIRNNPEALRDIVTVARQQAVWSKQAASYWLGIVAFEHEQFDVAVDYFKTRTLEAWPDGPWTAGARYNLARTYEWIGLRDNDDEVLSQSTSLLRQDAEAPQGHGNLLRAQRIEQHRNQPPDA